MVSVYTDSTVEDVFRRIRILFDDPGACEPSPGRIDELLTKLATSESCDSVSQEIAIFIKDIATFHPNLGHILLVHLQDLPCPAPFIEIIPTMFCVAAPSLVSEAVTQLTQLAQRDSRFLLPVLAAITDLPLPQQPMSALAHFMEDAVDVVDETDLPALFRVILKCFGNGLSLRPERAIMKLRSQVTLTK